jgi:xanthine dehydrogenase accessory factor
MSDLAAQIDAILAAEGRAVLITITGVRGSSPREVGAAMAVRGDGRFCGTIGGGALEWQALAEAQKLFRDGAPGTIEQSFTLGPDLGQCCGGRVSLRFQRLGTTDRPRLEDLVWSEAPMPLWLFGAGHIGRALVLALAPLPFDVRWIDPRRSEFPAAFPRNVTPVATDDPVGEIANAPAGAAILIFTHSHALDLAIADAALRRDDLAFTGVIGSATKRARFVSQLRQAGLPPTRINRLICPIGLPGLGSKAPAIIAAGIAVQMLRLRAERISVVKDVKHARRSEG